MTQQQNTRKIFPAVVGEGNVRVPVTHTKASGDSNEKRRNRSKSKNNKVPKNIRYDLENALVSLCDVWFEEIKPYLVRNNIKVHVHGAGAAAGAGDRDSAPAASQCSHLDPASTASQCDLCRLLFNAANSIESAVSQAASAPAPPGNGSHNAGQMHSRCYNCQENSPSKPRRRLKLTRRHANDFQPVVPPAFYIKEPQKGPPPKVQETRNKTHILNKNSLIQPATKPKKKDKSTQTEKLSVTQAKPNRIAKSCLKGFDRRDGTTTLFPIRREEKHNQLNKATPLFPQDLIEIIAKKSEKRLQVLFKSPALSPSSSIMNLLPSPKDVRNILPQKKPWR